MSTYLQFRKAKQHSHKYFVDQSTSDALCLCGKVKYSKKAAKGKYRAIRSVYNGYPYDSKFEAQTAMELDWRVKAGDIKSWDRQFSVKIENPKTGELIKRHKVDFRIHEKDGSYTLLEVKGFETADWRILRDMIEKIWLPEHLDYQYIVAK